MHYTQKFIFSCICALSISSTIKAMNAEQKINVLLSQCNAEAIQMLSASSQVINEKWPEIFEKIGVINYLLSTETLNSETESAIRFNINGLRATYNNYLIKQKKQVVANLVLAVLSEKIYNFNLNLAMLKR